MFIKHTGFTSHKRAGGLKATNRHLGYIKRNVEKNGKQATQLFNGNGPVDRKAFYEELKDQPNQGVIAHKLMITMSRGEADDKNLDIQNLTTETMAQWQLKQGRQFNWCASFHDHETHPHVHIVIAGRDSNGKEVAIYPKDLSALKELSEQVKEQAIERQQDVGQAKEVDILKEMEREEQELQQQNEREQDRGRSRADDLDR